MTRYVFKPPARAAFLCLRQVAATSPRRRREPATLAFSCRHPAISCHRPNRPKKPEVSGYYTNGPF